MKQIIHIATLSNGVQQMRTIATLNVVLWMGNQQKREANHGTETVAIECLHYVNPTMIGAVGRTRINPCIPN